MVSKGFNIRGKKLVSTHPLRWGCPTGFTPKCAGLLLLGVRGLLRHLIHLILEPTIRFPQSYWISHESCLFKHIFSANPGLWMFIHQTNGKQLLEHVDLNMLGITPGGGIEWP